MSDPHDETAELRRRLQESEAELIRLKARLERAGIVWQELLDATPSSSLDDLAASVNRGLELSELLATPE